MSTRAIAGTPTSSASRWTDRPGSEQLGLQRPIGTIAFIVVTFGANAGWIGAAALATIVVACRPVRATHPPAQWSRSGTMR
jgi:hypothetical protein